jgi:hypothetical protein
VLRQLELPSRACQNNLVGGGEVVEDLQLREHTPHCDEQDAERDEQDDEHWEPDDASVCET